MMMCTMTRTKIEWADMTINPVVGCSKCSPGCDNCYAERIAARLAKNPKTAANYAEVVDENGKWTGKQNITNFDFSNLYGMRKSKRIFVGSMTDIFLVRRPNLRDFFGSMKLCNQHTFMLLTKRPELMKEFMVNYYADNIDTLSNVWLGVTVCNQQEANEKIPVLMATPAAKRFVSIEPMLGPVDLKEISFKHSAGFFGDALQWHHLPHCRREELQNGAVYPSLDWVICGGETGPGARPMHPDWIRSLRDQCQGAKVPFFFKGWGGWIPTTINTDGRIGCWHDGKFYDRHGNIEDSSANMSRCKSKIYGHSLLDGLEWNEVPE